MPAKRRMYKGDLKPDYQATLTTELPGGSIVPLDLSTAVGVRVIGVLIDPETGAVLSTVFDRAATTYNDQGVVTMEWEPGDTDTVGWLASEIEVMWPNSKPQTVRPPEVVDIRDDFGGVV